MRRKLLDDCFLADTERIKHDEALALIVSRLSRVADPQSVPLRQADGRVLAADVVAPRPVPAFTNAAVDGYAFAQASLRPGAPLRVSARVQAGAQPGALRTGEAARIFTGAPMPEGADTCVMQEDTETVPDGVIVPPGLKRGANTRTAGEDFAAGAAVAQAGTRLRPQDEAAIAAPGTAAVACHRRLRVALISSGGACFSRRRGGGPCGAAASAACLGGLPPNPYPPPSPVTGGCGWRSSPPATSFSNRARPGGPAASTTATGR